MNVDAHMGTALITGACSEIGALYADRFARRGYDLILVARNGDRLNALAIELTDETCRSVEVVVADLTVRKDLARVENVLRTDASITLLLNNVGVTTPFAVANRLTIVVVPGFVARGRGTIVTVLPIRAVAPDRNTAA
jgi:uncharacterized protein